MDYTIIGGAVNLAARLQPTPRRAPSCSATRPGRSCATRLPPRNAEPIALKGFAKPVRRYEVRTTTAGSMGDRMIHAEVDGLRLQIDLDRLAPAAAARVLEGVLARLRRDIQAQCLT